MGGEAAVELVTEEDVAEFGPIVSQHGPVLLPGGGQQGQVHFAARVQQVCEPEKQLTTRTGVSACEGSQGSRSQELARLRSRTLLIPL